jgi:hypothetical protein
LFDDFCGDNDYLFKIVFLYLESFYISRCVVSTFVHDSSFGSIRSISQDDLKQYETYYLWTIVVDVMFHIVYMQIWKWKSNGNLFLIALFAFLTS